MWGHSFMLLKESFGKTHSDMLLLKIKQRIFFFKKVVMPKKVFSNYLKTPLYSDVGNSVAELICETVRHSTNLYLYARK